MLGDFNNQLCSKLCRHKIRIPREEEEEEEVEEEGEQREEKPLERGIYVVVSRGSC